MSKYLLIISHYNSRPKNNLKALISSTNHLEIERVVVVNDDDILKPEISKDSLGITFLHRQNTGMNIGGWNDAYSIFKDFDYYIFIQDECIILDFNFIFSYKEILDEKNIGMIGESINEKWNKSWDEMLKSPLNYTDQNHTDNNVQIPRVLFYLNMLKKWNITPGINASHLRSLVWAFKNETLKNINGFPIGLSKGECIAAEIAVSKKIEQTGLQIKQVSDIPFKFIYHTEWKKNGYSKF